MKIFQISTILSETIPYKNVLFYNKSVNCLKVQKEILINYYSS
jgi:hypothetical protein